MKRVIIFNIALYQIVLSPLLKSLLGTSQLCKFTPTCSEYTKNMIARFGIFKGTQLGIERFVTCR